MSKKLKHQIVQYDTHHIPVFAPQEWSKDFRAITTKYQGKSCMYPAIVQSDTKEPIACGALLFEKRTGWIVGLHSTAQDQWAFSKLELLSHLTDFANSMQMDNILALIPKKEKQLFEQCGYTATELLQTYTPGHTTHALAESNTITEPVTKENEQETLTFVNGILDETRTDIFAPDTALQGAIVRTGKAISGVLLYHQDYPIYTNCETAAKALIQQKLALNKPIFTVSNDNPLALQIFADLGLTLQNETYRMSLGKDNRWKYRSLFSSFSHFCI